MKRIVWTEVAVVDLKNIYSYIAKDSDAYAKAVILEIFDGVEQLELFPRSGRVVPEFMKENTRELLVGSYRIIYDIAGSKIRILTIIHGARLLRRNR